ncbi:MAG TPA: hypothetical protein VM142_03420 [Acidimicrobiales bacterium]|nr:hypothetical protein [Acidimicrobiales bacterium]
MPGVFSLAGTADTWRQKTLAAVLSAGQGAVASHTTAAALFGLSCCKFQGVEITVPIGRSHRSHLATVHETAFLNRSDMTTIDRIPVTRPARTLVDLASSTSKAVLEEAVDDALIRRLVTLDRLRACATALGGSGRKGTLLLQEVLRCWTTGGMAEEVAEMRMVRRLLAAELPKPVLQYRVHDAMDRFVARLDAAYPQEKVGLEMNGFRWHGSPRRFALDPQRTRRLVALGWLILPCTPVDLAGDGRELAEQVRAAREHGSSAKKCG